MGLTLAQPSRWRRARHLILFSFLPGLAAAAGQAPLHLWWLALAGWLLAILPMRRITRWTGAFVAGWVAGAGYVAGTHFWIVEPFFVDAPRHGWMAPFALVGMVAGIALFWGVGYALAFRVADSPAGRVLALIPALTLMDLARTHVFTGFPWATIGSLWVGQPVLQFTSIVGPLGMTMLTVLLVALPVAAQGRRRWAAALISGVIFAAISGWGLFRVAAPLEMSGPVVRVVQPNAAQHLKWQPDMIPVFFGRQLELTAATGPLKPDFVVWPETAIAYRLDQAQAAFDLMTDAADGVPIVFGVQRREGLRYYNSLAVLGADGQVSAVYDKHHLVPFGEYIPLADLLAPLGFGSFASQFGNGYSAGPGAHVISVAGVGKILPLICYEAIFPNDVGAATERADWIVHITNDAWFGKTVMPYQHLDQARQRAVEQGLAVVRSANTGVSAVIDPYGRILAEIPLGESGKIDVALPRPVPETLYARWGDWPVGFVLLICACAGFVRLRERKLDPEGEGP